MLKMIISGCNGHMGRTVAGIAAAEKDIEVVAGFDVTTVKTDTFPVYADPMEFSGAADVIIDFSNPSALENLLTYCVAKKIPIVLCTTGHSQEQMEKVDDASKIIPIFKSANMSIGINLVADLIQRACTVLGSSFDVEIVERHHRRKVDAPSGTALILADAAAASLPYKPEYIYGRHDRRQARADNEIGVSAVRGGSIVGEHEIIFAGLDEVIEIKHTAYSRDVFASGAVRASRFISTVKEPGVYNMQDLLTANQ